MSMTVLTLSTKRSLIRFGALVLAVALGKSADAQNSYTWDAVGNGNGSMGDPLNWQPNGVPNFGATSNGDSLIFSSSTNTAVLMTDDSAGDQVANITFDANAPAYTFTATPGHTDNDFAIRGGILSNQSAHTQDFTGTLDVYFPSSAVLDASGGDPSTQLAFKLNTMIVNGNSTVKGAFNTTITGYGGTSASQQLTMLGSGTLFITGDGTTQYNGGAGILNIGASTTGPTGPYGMVLISNSNALGVGGSTSSNYTRIYGNGNSNGTLGLTGGITTNEGFLIFGRQNDVTRGYDTSSKAAILNVSGNNTLTGPFSFSGGGGAYVFGSDSGLLTIQSNMNWTPASDRYFIFQGNGDGLVSGNITGSGSNVGVPIHKYGNGTLTLAGTANTHMSNWFIHGGTLAIANGTGLSFAASTDLGVAPVIMLQNNSTFDVSAVLGGYTSTQSIYGNSGNVLGNIAMAAGTQVLPGTTVTFDPVNAYSVAGFAAGVGQINFHNGLDLSQGSQMVWHLGALSTSGPGTNFDQLTVGGALTLGGSSSLSIDLSLLSGGSQPGGGDPFWSSSHTWTIISNSSNPGSSNFASIVNGVVATGTFTTSVSSGALLGDVNGDHVVNGLDIAVVASHWLLTGATLGQGDANGDGTVNGLDIALIASHWLSTGGGSGGGILLTYTPSAGGGTAVPEPSTFVLAGVGLTGLLIARRRRS